MTAAMSEVLQGSRPGPGFSEPRSQGPQLKRKTTESNPGDFPLELHGLHWGHSVRDTGMGPPGKQPLLSGGGEGGPGHLLEGRDKEEAKG